MCPIYSPPFANSRTNRATLASQTIITMLPSSPEVRNVYGTGVLPTLRRLTEDQTRRTLCIDSTTLDITVARNVAADVVAAGAQMVDAPVSGGMFLVLHFMVLTKMDRCDWRESRHAVLPRWRHSCILQTCAYYSVPHGPAYYTLWPVWFWVRCKDMQQRTQVLPADLFVGS